MTIGIGEGQSTTIQQKPIIRIPPGKFEAPLPRDNNFHEIITTELNINGHLRRVQLLHQLRPGDCVLANFVNTCSIEEASNKGIDSKLPMTIQEAKQSAIEIRRAKGDYYGDITSPNSPLDHKDVVELFSSIYGIPPKQEDILTIDGRNKTVAQLRLDALTVMDYLDTYPSGLCTIGLNIHSQTIKKLQGDNFALIDPMNASGMKIINQIQLMDFLATKMSG